MGNAKVTVGIPGIATYEWAPAPEERKAAWELYVELSTRAGVWHGVSPAEGSIRELLGSLHDLFRETRSILRAYTECLSKPEARLGELGISLLSGQLRDFLTRWHPLLSSYEHKKSSNIPPIEWEQQWSERDRFWEALDEVRSELQLYMDVLKDLF